MDPEVAQVFDFVRHILPFVATIMVIAVGGWVFTTWLRIKNGYPLETSWGRPIHPHTDKESVERIRLLTGENAQLRAELGSVKDRLEVVERIVTDQPHRLAQEIDRLAIDKGGRA
jgi:hypothetical protein